nr:Rne/Rng family ribonuclease [uncultured Desulfuromonas sp.]
MSKKMLINATLPEEDRVAIVEDGILTELDIETAGHQQTKGNIYKGEVIRVEQGLQAAFIDYGAQRPGFLQIGEIHPSLYPNRESDEGQSNRRPAITDILKRGQQLLVQVVKEERGTKGAALTTEISLPGRYMVLIPQSSSRGISRKIDNDQIRKQIKHTLSSLELPDEMGYIIRTAAIDQPPEELKRDFDYLLNTYNSIVSHSDNAKAPALIYQESNLVLRSIRDYFTPEIDEVLIDDRDVFQQARDFFKAVMPEYVNLVKLHQERRPIFARYQIEEQISQLSSNTVALPSGGSIVLDQTEALVAIDVNSGKMGGEQDVEATAHRVNLEAAVEVARQLRLRDMGGLIVIDFIDMRQRRNAREVEKALKTALKIDKARVTVGRISQQFGLLEMSRQRIKANLGAGSFHMCPHCQGSGRIRSEESRSVALLRRIQAGTAKGHIESVICTTALDTANYLLNNKRRELYDLEQRYKLTIEIKADPSYLPEQLDIDFVKQSRDSGLNTPKELGPLVDTDLSERANIEVVLPDPVTVEEPEEMLADTAEEASDEAPRKSSRRRRRSNRRRNDRNRKNDEPGSESAVDVDANRPEAAIEPSSDDASPASHHSLGEDQPQEQTSAKAATSEADSPRDTETSPTSEPSESEAKNSESEEKKPARKPARRRAPRRNVASKTEQQEGSKAEETTQTASVEQAKPDMVSANAEAATAMDENTGQEESKPAPRRRPSRKTTAGNKVASADADQPETTPEPQDSGEADAAPKKRVTRTRRKPAQDTTAAEKEQGRQDKEAAPAPSTPEEKKPARRRTTRKKTTDTNPESSSPEPDNGGDSAPPKKPTRRRSTQTTSSEASPQESSDTAEEESKKPTRRRTTKKSPASKTTAEKDAASQTQETPEKNETENGDEKPKRRAPRRKKAAPVEPKNSDETITSES